MSIQTEIGREIVSARIEQGITQSELASRAGINVSHLRLIEHGRGNPTIATLGCLARSLGRTLLIVMKPR